MERQTKLSKLNRRENAKTIALITGDDFTDILEDKIQALRELQGKGIELNNIDELVNYFQIVKTFQSELKELREAVKDFHVPKSMEIAGLDAILTKFEALNKLDLVSASIDALNKTFTQIQKAVNDDIYARYDFANSGYGPAGQYIGYLAHNGNWFIQRIGTATNGDRSSTFAAGLDAYKQNWQIKEKLNYQTRDRVTI